MYSITTQLGTVNVTKVGSGTWTLCGVLRVYAWVNWSVIEWLQALELSLLHPGLFVCLAYCSKERVNIRIRGRNPRMWL